jgi:hypothetical protein
MEEIDDLTVKVNADAKQADSALEKLVSQLETVNKALGKIMSGNAFSNMAESAKVASASMQDISTSTKRVSDEIGSQMKKASNSIKGVETPVKETFKSIEDVLEKLGQKSIDIKPEIDVANLSSEQKKYTEQLKSMQNGINRVLNSAHPEKKIGTLDSLVVKLNEAKNALKEIESLQGKTANQTEFNPTIHLMGEDERNPKDILSEYKSELDNWKSYLENFNQGNYKAPTTGFTESIGKSLEELKAEFPDAKSLIADYEKLFEDFSAVSVDGGMEKSVEPIKKIEEQVGELNNVFDNIKPLEFTGNFYEMEKWVDDLNTKLISLLDKREKLTDLGSNMDTQRIKSMTYDIEQLSRTIEKYEVKVEEARKAGKLEIKIPGIDESLSNAERQAREFSVRIANEFKKSKIKIPVEFNEVEKEIQKVKNKYDELVRSIGLNSKRINFYGSSDDFKKKQIELAALREEYQKLINKQKELSLDESALRAGQFSNQIKTATDATRKLSNVFSSIGFTSFPGFLSGIGSAASQLPGIFSSITVAVDGTSSALTGMQASIPIIGAILAVLSTLFNLARKLGNAIKNVASKVISAFKKMLSGIKSIVSKIGSLISSIGEKFSEMGFGIDISASSMFKSITKFIVALGRRIRSLAVTSVTNNISDALTALAQKSTELDYNLTNLKQNLATLGASIVSAFEPILNAVIPILNQLIQKLIYVTQLVGQFIAALFGKTSYKVPTASVKGYAEALDDASDSAKKLKGNLQGFDKLNVITSEDKTGKSSKAGNVEYGFKDMPISSKISDLAKKLKDMWDKGDFYDLGKWLGDKLAKTLANIPWDKIKKAARKLGSSLATLINGFIKGEFDGKSIGYWIGHTLGEAINTAFEFLNEVVHKLDWKGIGQFFADLINEFMNILDWELIIDTFTTGAKGLADLINNFNSWFNWELFGQTLANIFNTITATLYAFFDELNLYDIAVNIGTAIKNIADNIDWNAFLEMAKKIGQKMVDAIQGLADSDVISNCGTILGNILKGVIDWAFEFFANIPYRELGEEIGKFINNVFSSLSEVDESGKSGWQKLGETIDKIARGLLEMFIKACQEIDLEQLKTGIREMMEQINFVQLFADAFVLVSNLKSGLLQLFIAAIDGIQLSIGEALGNALRNAINYAMNGQSIDLSGLIRTTRYGASVGANIGRKVFRGYASGGFIEPATYFKAGENGVPEILGTVGGKSAVAGGQEITGISNAIYSTGQTEAQLLSSAVQFLQIIANKDFSINSSDAFNAIREEAHSYEKRTGDKAFT